MAITINIQPQRLSPTHNPIVYNLTSTNYQLEGFRYLIDLYQTNDNSLIGRFKITPDINGDGYMDASRILSNFVSYYFIPSNLSTSDASGTSLNYYAQIGEEYLYELTYTGLTKQSGGIYDGQTKINFQTPHDYTVGDQVNISTISTGTTSTVNGLHLVQSASTNEIIINNNFPITGSSIAISGTVTFADFRKKQYTGITTSTGTSVFNGALDWPDWKIYNSQYYEIIYNDPIGFTKIFLTSYLTKSIQDTRDKVYVYTNQRFYFNFFTTASTETKFALKYTQYDKNNVIKANVVTPLFTSSPFGNMKQFYFSYDDAGLIGEEGDVVELQLTNSGGTSALTALYSFYFKDKCRREANLIYFMDRYGSILSLPFENKITENIKVQREVYKQATIYGTNSSLDLTKGGSKIYNLEVKRQYELQSDWMNDANVRLYSELMQSTNVWLHLENEFEDTYYPCIVQETDAEITYQKNKQLIRKTITVELSNQRPTND